MIKTSLIITVYNRSHLIRKALLSLLNQTQKPDELILSDDIGRRLNKWRSERYNPFRCIYELDNPFDEDTFSIITLN